jgi:hypothetical protein
MADNDDVPIGPAGRDYYARQFGPRLGDIRKNVPAPASTSRPYAGSTGAGCGARLIGSLVVGGILLVIRIVTGFGSYHNSSSYNSSYSPSYTPPSTYTPPPPPAPSNRWDNQPAVPDDKGKKPADPWKNIPGRGPQDKGPEKDKGRNPNIDP